jgi:hypothetical protein
MQADSGLADERDFGACRAGWGVDLRREDHTFRTKIPMLKPSADFIPARG